jgi:hypothetical protein
MKVGLLWIIPSVYNRPKFLSPSALSVWLGNQEEYFQKYLAVNKQPRMPQTQAMSVGSAFDAYVKHYLHRALGGTDPRFEKDALFEIQVESQNRDFARKAGAHCFAVYSSSGALDELLRLLQKSPIPVKMETTETNTVVDGSVPLLGKPDLAFGSPTGFLLTLDWKVNGYCSIWGKAPTKGYVDIRDESGGKKGPHKEASTWNEHGIVYNTTPSIEREDDSWARQLATYSWLAGKKIGEELIVFVEQLCVNKDRKIRIAHHRSVITETFQRETYKQYANLWEVVNSDHIFRDLSLADSQARCEVLSRQMINSDDTDDERWLKEAARKW